MLDKIEIRWRHLGGPVEPSEGKDRESAMAIPWFLCGSPHLCRLRNEGWYPWASIECINHMLVFIGPVSLVVVCQWKFDFSPLSHWLLCERSWVRTHRLVNRCAVDCVGSSSSQGQWIYSNLLMTVWKIATYVDRPQEAYAGHTCTGMGNVRVVLTEFSLAGCTPIRIVATLGYE
jgi:hypothetical protein